MTAAPQFTREEKMALLRREIGAMNVLLAIEPGGGITHEVLNETAANLPIFRAILADYEAMK